jgi:hypothetical protein
LALVGVAERDSGGVDEAGIGADRQQAQR